MSLEDTISGLESEKLLKRLVEVIDNVKESKKVQLKN